MDDAERLARLLCEEMGEDPRDLISVRGRLMTRAETRREEAVRLLAQERALARLRFAPPA